MVYEQKLHLWKSEMWGHDCATYLKDDCGQMRDLFVGCLMSQQHASVSPGRICSDNFTCCHTEIEAADPTFYLTESQYTDTGPTRAGIHEGPLSLLKGP